MHIKIEVVPSGVDSVLCRKFHYFFNADEKENVMVMIKAEHADLGKELMIEITRDGARVWRTDKVKAEVKFERHTQKEVDTFDQLNAVATKRKKR